MDVELEVLGDAHKVLPPYACLEIRTPLNC